MDQSAITLVTLIFAALLQPITAVVKQNRFPPWANALIALGMCGVGAAFVEFTTGGYKGLSDPMNWVTIYGQFVAYGTTIYHTLWHDNPIDRALDEVGPWSDPHTPPDPPEPTPALVVPPIVEPAERPVLFVKPGSAKQGG